MISLSDGRSELYQWDTGRQVSFAGSCQQFHFSNKVYGRTVDVDASTGDGTSTAKIPDFLLQTASPLSVYAFVGSDLDGYTKVEKVFQVQRRNKPADYVFTPPEQHTIQDAKEYAESAQKSAQTATETLEKIKPLAESTQENATEAAKSAEQAQQSAEGAAQSEAQAKGHADDAGTDAGKASQALSDLLKMLGTDIPTLDAGGKIPLEQIPATATQEIYVVKSEAELTGLKAQRGDLAELIGPVADQKTRAIENRILKTWQCLGDPTSLKNWVEWGTSYAVQAGNATNAQNAVDSTMINGHRMVEMEKDAFETAVKDPTTYYLVHDPKSEV